MKAVYVETSAVLAWLLGESSAQVVRERVDAANAVLTSVLTYVETERGLLRTEASESLSGGDAQRLRGLLARARSNWLSMAISEEVLARAGRAFPVEPLRTLDAIHLATALEFTKGFPEMAILSFDQRINENARALGIL